MENNVIRCLCGKVLPIEAIYVKDCGWASHIQMFCSDACKEESLKRFIPGEAERSSMILSLNSKIENNQLRELIARIPNQRGKTNVQ